MGKHKKDKEKKKHDDGMPADGSELERLRSENRELRAKLEKIADLAAGSRASGEPEQTVHVTEL